MRPTIENMSRPWAHTRAVELVQTVLPLTFPLPCKCCWQELFLILHKKKREISLSSVTEYSSEGLCDQVFIFIFSSRLFSPSVCPSWFLHFIVMSYMSEILLRLWPTVENMSWPRAHTSQLNLCFSLLFFRIVSVVGAEFFDEVKEEYVEL